MTTKKTEQLEETDVAETIEQIAESVEEAQPVARELPYKLVPWGGLPHWECNFCPFDSMDEAAMWWHFHEEHEHEQEGA